MDFHLLLRKALWKARFHRTEWNGEEPTVNSYRPSFAAASESWSARFEQACAILDVKRTSEMRSGYAPRGVPAQKLLTRQAPHTG